MQLDEPRHKEGIYTTFSAETYIKNSVEKLAAMYGLVTFPKFSTPMDSEYHSELDESPLCDANGISMYRSLIESANWCIIPGCFDIIYTVTTLACYSCAP